MAAGSERARPALRPIGRGAATLLAAAALGGCAHYDLRPPPRPGGGPALARAADGVEIRLAPTGDAYAAFDRDLRGHGIYPLFIALANRTGGEVGFARQDVVVSTAGAPLRALTASEVATRLEYRPAARYFGWSFGLFGIGIVPGIVDFFRATAANNAIWQDVPAKQIPDAPVAPDQTVRGFVFFESAGAAPDRAAITVTLGDGPRAFEFRLLAAPPPVR